MSGQVWTTLGTAAGPGAGRGRAQPANLLRHKATAVLVDAGDGVADQLARAGTPLGEVRAVVLSHLHADHIGGLFALLGRRRQPRIGGALTVYGPRGTARLVKQLVAALGCLTDLQNALNPGGGPVAPVAAIEVTEGDTFALDEINVTATINTHYRFPPGSGHADLFQSLSYRFDTPERAVCYTGDTGPSANVERLAAGVDLLVSEIIDPNSIPPLFRNRGPAAEEFLKRHFEREHLSPEAVGRLARRCGAARLVLTHIGVAEAGLAAAAKRIGEHYSGPVEFADDLDSF